MSGLHDLSPQEQITTRFARTGEDVRTAAFRSDAARATSTDRVRAVLWSFARGPGIAGLIIALFVVDAAVWLAIDRSVWSWDPASYGMEALDLWAKLRTNLHLWHYEMLHALTIRPPAIAWGGQFFVPLHRLLGAVEPALLLSILVWQTASLVLVVVTGLRLTRGRILPVLFGLLLITGAPLFVNLTHAFFVEPIQTFSLMWVLFIMVSADRWHPSLTLAQLAAATSLGLLTKISTPVYMAIPAAIAIAGSVTASRGRAQPAWWRAKFFVASALLAAVMALGVVEWYRVNWQDAYQNTEFSLHSTLYGSKRSFASNLWFRIRQLDHSLFLPYFDIAVGAVVLIAVVVTRRRRGNGLRRGVAYQSLCILGCLAAAAVPLIGLALQRNDADRFLMPVIPAIGLALVGIVDWIPRARFTVMVATGVVAVQFCAISADSLWAFVPRSQSYSPHPPEHKTAFVRELDRIIALSCTQSGGDTPTIVGANYPWLSATAMQFRAWAMFNVTGPRCYYGSLDVPRQDPKVVLRELEAPYVHRPFYVSVDFARLRTLYPTWFRDRARRTIANPDETNKLDLRVFHTLSRSRNWFVVPAYRRDGLIVLRRR